MKPHQKFSESTPSAPKRSLAGAFVMLTSFTGIVSFRVLGQFATDRVNFWTWAGIALLGVFAILWVALIAKALKPGTDQPKV